MNGSVTVHGAEVNSAPLPRGRLAHGAWLTARHNRPLSPLASIRPGVYFLVVRGDAPRAMMTAHKYGFSVASITAESGAETGITVNVSDFDAARRLAAWQRAEAESIATHGSVLSAIRVARNFTPLPVPKAKPKGPGYYGAVTVSSS